MPDAIRTMEAADVISAKLANCYIIVGSTRKLLFQAKDLKATKKEQKASGNPGPHDEGQQIYVARRKRQADDL